MPHHPLLDQLIEVRGYLLASVRGLTDEQFLRVPEGFNNNILWNVGHVITDNTSMLYPPTGNPFPSPEQYLRWFEPGTSQADWEETPPIAEVIAAAETMRDKVIEDCNAGKMETFEPMPLDDGVVLRNIAQAIAHCNIHEAMHLAVIDALRRRV